MTRSPPSVIRSTSHGFDKRKMTGISHMPNLRLAPLLPADALRELPTHFSLRSPLIPEIIKIFWRNL